MRSTRLLWYYSFQNILVDTLLSAECSLETDLQTPGHLVIVEVFVALRNVFEFIYNGSVKHMG
jgi:hypothetical protein